jgi:hypothetical protein
MFKDGYGFWWARLSSMIIVVISDDIFSPTRLVGGGDAKAEDS